MYVLQLEVVGPGGPPDGHGDEENEHHHWFHSFSLSRVFYFLFHIFLQFFTGIKKFHRWWKMFLIVLEQHLMQRLLWEQVQ